jgi:hypothetical protein
MKRRKARLLPGNDEIVPAEFAPLSEPVHVARKTTTRHISLQALVDDDRSISTQNQSISRT